MTSKEPRIYALLMRLRTGGVLIRGEDCSPGEIEQAKREGGYAVDSDGHTYVWLPPFPSIRTLTEEGAA